MPNERFDQMCTAFYSDKHNGQLVVAVTGGTTTLATDFYIISEDRWETGPDLPESLWQASAIPSIDFKGMLLLGGQREFDPQIFALELICDSMRCLWSRRNFVLDSYRIGATAIRIPSRFVKCNFEILSFKPPRV